MFKTCGSAPEDYGPVECPTPYHARVGEVSKNVRVPTVVASGLLVWEVILPERVIVPERNDFWGGLPGVNSAGLAVE